MKHVYKILGVKYEKQQTNLLKTDKNKVQTLKKEN